MKILTITADPFPDKNIKTHPVHPKDKIRCNVPYYKAEGGGINVPSALKKTGTGSTALFLPKGWQGNILQQLLDDENIDQVTIETKLPIHENLMIHGESTNQPYHFGFTWLANKTREREKILRWTETLKIPPEYIASSET